MEGDACSPDIFGSLEVCPFGLECGAAGTCRPLTAIDEGVCNSIGTPICADSFPPNTARFCDVPPGQTEGRCADTPQLDEPCPRSDCARDAACDFNAGVPLCKDRSPAGGPCNNEESSPRCDSPLVCVDGTCIAVADVETAIGAVCPVEP